MLCTNNVLSGYKTVKHLGSGSVGAVDLVTVGHRNYVLKSIDVYNIEDALIEINNLKLLQDVSNILKLHGVCYDQGRKAILIFSEAMDDNLWDWHVTQTRDVIRREFPRILTQISTALDCLHQLNIGHFDLKPQNILCKSTPLGMVYKLADFGTSSLQYRMDSLTFNIGTYVYQAPEVLLRKSAGLQSDIWSLGLSLITLLYPAYLGLIDGRKDFSHICMKSTVYPEGTQIDCIEFIRRYKDQSIEGYLHIPKGIPNEKLLQQMMQLNPLDRVSPRDIQEYFGQTPQVVQISEDHNKGTSIPLEDLNIAWRLLRRQRVSPLTNLDSFSINDVRNIITVELVARYKGGIDLYTTTAVMAYIAEVYIYTDFVDPSDYSNLLNITDTEFMELVFQVLNSLDYRIYNPHLQSAIQNVAEKSKEYPDDYHLYNWYYTFQNAELSAWFTESYTTVLRNMEIYPPVIWKKNVSMYRPPFTEDRWHSTMLDLQEFCVKHGISSQRAQVWIIYLVRKYLETHHVHNVQEVVSSAVYTYKKNNLENPANLAVDLHIASVMQGYPYFNTIIDYIQFNTESNNKSGVYSRAKALALLIYTYDTYSDYSDVQLAKVCIELAYDLIDGQRPSLTNRSPLYIKLYRDTNIVGIDYH